MKLDRTLIKEIKALTGNGSREAKFALLDKIDAARKDLSSTKIRDTFDVCLIKHGRAVVCICVAATLDARRERLDGWGWSWGYKVLSLLPQNFTPSNIHRACIDDGIHPTAICEYAEELIRLTTEE